MTSPHIESGSHQSAKQEDSVCDYSFAVLAAENLVALILIAALLGAASSFIAFILLSSYSLLQMQH